jgi:hypothetical protein
MTIPFEKQYEDVLQNIEFAIVAVYRENRELSDWSVEAALDGLLRTYQAEARGRTAPKLRFSDLEQQLFDRIRAMCEWRLGREQIVTEANEQPIEFEIAPITLEELLACLKRVRKSVDRWHKSGGRRGYLDFVSRFIL